MNICRDTCKVHPRSAFNRIKRKEVWKCFDQLDVPQQLLENMEQLYRINKAQINGKTSGAFHIKTK